jgi:hypothetical protein
MADVLPGCCRAGKLRPMTPRPICQTDWHKETSQVIFRKAGKLVSPGSNMLSMDHQEFIVKSGESDMGHVSRDQRRVGLNDARFCFPTVIVSVTKLVPRAVPFRKAK